MIANARFGLELAIGTVAVDPFTLALSINNLTLVGPENTAVVAIDRIDARIRPGASVLAAGWVLGDTAIDGLRLDLDGAHVASAAGAIASGELRIGAGDVGFNGSLVANAVSVTRAGDDASVIDIERLSADGAVIDASPSLSASLIRLERPTLQVSRDAAGLYVLPPSLFRLLLGPAAGESIIGRVEVVAGSLSCRDALVKPPATFRINALEGVITRQAAGATRPVAVTLRGRLMDGGRAAFDAEWQPGRAARTIEVEVSLREVGLEALSPYIAPVIGRDLDAGLLDLDVDIDGESSLVSGRLVAHRPAFGEPYPGAEALPVELASALLEDAGGRVSATIVVGGERVAADPARVLSGALVDYVERLAAAPFDYLAEFAGVPDIALAALAFPPGSAEFGADTRRRISALGRVLQQRPALGLLVYGGYEPAADRAALAREQIRLHVTLASSARPPGAGAEGPIDFDDPTVQGVIDEFAAERLPKELRADIRTRFAGSGARYYRAAFDALIDNEPVTRQALDRLARYRAQTVIDALRALGVADGRLRPAGPVFEADPAAPGVVRLELQPTGALSE